jgi:translation initiation factor 5A
VPADDAAPVDYVLAGELKVRDYVIIGGHACRIYHMSEPQNGKHGARKTILKAKDIFTGKERSTFFYNHSRVEIPILERNEYTLIDLNDEDGFMSLMSDVGEIREDLKLPGFPEMDATELRALFASGKQLVVTVLKAYGNEKVVGHKVDAKEE